MKCLNVVRNLSVKFALLTLSFVFIPVMAQADTLAGIAVFNPPDTSDHVPVMPGQLLGNFQIINSEAELGYDPVTGAASTGRIRLSYEGQFADNGTQCIRSKSFTYILSGGQAGGLGGTYTLAWRDAPIGVPFGFEGSCSPLAEGDTSGSWMWRERTDDDNVGLQGNLIDVLDASGAPLAEFLVTADECPDCDGNRPPVILEWLVSNETPAVDETVHFLLQVFDPDPGDTLSFSWIVDGVLTDTKGDGISYTPREPGTVKITAVVSDPHGATDTITFTLEVQGDCAQQAGCSTAPEITQVHLPSPLDVGEDDFGTISFQDENKDVALVVFQAFDGANWIDAARFDPGVDGLEAGSFPFEIVCPDTPGSYRFQVQLEDADGNKSRWHPFDLVCVQDAVTVNVSVSLRHDSPAPGNHPLGQPINLLAVPEGFGEGSLSYAWTVNGIRQNATQSSVNWNASTPGTFMVGVIVTDGLGGQAEAALTFTVVGCTAPPQRAHPLSISISASTLQPDNFGVRPQQTNVTSCNREPVIEGLSIKPKVMMRIETPTLTVRYDNPGASTTGSIVFEEPGFLTPWSEVGSFPVSLKANGKGDFPVVSWDRCAKHGSYFFRVTLVTQEGSSNPMSYSYKCVGGDNVRPQLTEQEKDNLIRVAENWDGVSKLGAMLLVACGIGGFAVSGSPIPFYVCDVLLASATGFAAFEETVLIKLARDPADPNFKVVAKPLVKSASSVTDVPEIPRGVAATADALFTNMASVIAVSQALLHALERGQGASLAGDQFWYEEQTAAAAELSSKLSNLLVEQTGMLQHMKTEWNNAGLPDITLSQSDMQQVQKHLATNKLPDALTDILRRLGASANDIEGYRQKIVSADTRAIGGNLLEMIVSPSMVSSMQATSQSLQGFSDSLGGSPPSPPSDALSVPQALDTNNNGVLDSSEVRVAIQMWILSQPVPGTDQTIDDPTMRSLIEMWILGTPVGQRAMVASIAQSLNVHAVALQTHSPMERTLHVQGQHIASVRLQVFNLNGQLKVQSQSRGSQLRFSLLNKMGQPLANGVYLYRVTVQGVDGNSWYSGIRKMMVLR